ncbi:MAG: hypothetical protein K9G76_01875 [Bacteroidales bacterium]|nr:hypothetical protein [Bacteroidales bacterium]MCF8403302.1 hypothetical protein [Bacteroidales bacterium]
MKTYFNIILLCIFSLTLVTQSVSGQNKPAQIPANPLEIIDLETDRTLYLSGENIWFRIFCVSKNDPSKASSLSYAIYVELFDAQQKVVSKQKIKIIDGVASGKIIIPVEQPTGNYFLRAYTRYFRNYPPAFYPQVTMTILNPDQVLRKYRNENTGTVKIISQNQGGITDSDKIAAFTLSDDLLVMADSLKLFDKDEKVFSDVKLFENGSGLLYLDNFSGNKLNLILYLSNGDSLLQEINRTPSPGYTARSQIKNDSVYYTITFDDTYKKPDDPNLKLAIYNDHFLKTFQTNIVAGENYRKSFYKFEISQGINHFVLTNQLDSTLNIQTVYNIQARQLIAPEKMKYSPREKIKLEIRTEDLDYLASSVFSLAVVKKGTSSGRFNSLPGFLVKNPLSLLNYEITSSTLSESFEEQIKACLILYQEQLLQSQNFWAGKPSGTINLDWLPETRGVTLSGIVRDKETKLPASDQSLLLTNLSKQEDVFFTRVKEGGLFNFSMPLYFSRQDLFLSTLDLNTNNEILVNTDFSEDFPEFNQAPLAIDFTYRDLIESMLVNYQLSIAKEENTLSSETPYTFSSGFGEPEISIKLADYIDLPSMDVVLNEIVPFVKFRERKGQYKFTIIDSQTNLIYTDPLVLVDNIPLANMNDLIKIHPSSVEKIDVINKTFYLGDEVLQGIVLITTKTGNFGGISLPEDATFINFQTLQPMARFQNHEYSNGEEITSPKPDYRTLLYWNPSLKLKANMDVVLYASDHPSEYEVILKGIDKKGNRFVSVSEFEIVKENE